MTVKTPARFGASVKAVLLAGVSFLAVSPAQASLVGSIPGGTTVTPPNNGTVPASFFSNTGPIQLGTGIGRDIVWSSNNPSAVGGYSGGYGLCSNGSWTGTPAYFGTNSPNNAQTMTFSFNDANASAVGGFMNWGAGCFASADFTIQAFDASNVLLESYTLNFSAPGTNNGQFFAISRPSADIKYFVIFGGFAVLRDFTFLSFLGCPVGVGNDTCLIDSTTNQATAIDADGGIDTLQVGGATNFAFGVAAIGTTFTNFETFQKVGASNVTLTGVAGVAANWDIQAGTLTASTGNNIFNTSAVNVGAAGTFAVASSETIGRLTGSGATTLAAGQTLTVGDATNFAYTGTTSGAGGLTKVGAGTMSTGNLGHLGLTTVAAGTLNVNGSIADSVLISAGATLSGNTNILGSLTLNAGGVLRPGNSPGTTVVGGNFIGGGTILTEVQFNNAGAPVNGTTHDFLNIAGNASGTTLLNVVPFAPSNAPVATTGNGIELVRVGGTTGAGTFQLAAPLIFGSLEYALNYLPNYTGTTDGYFLQSRASETMHGEAAMLAAGQTIIAGCIMGEDALVGDGNAHRGRTWAKAGRGNRDTGADTGLDASNDYRCAAGGIDVGATENLRLGLGGGFGVSDSYVNTPAGLGRLEGDGGMVQLYAEFHMGDFFASVTGGWGVFDWSFDGPNTAVMLAQVDGTVGALQLGHAWTIDWLRLSAIGEVAYNGMDCGADCFLAGTTVDANEWFYEGTLRADTVLSDGELRPYLALSLADGGTNTATNGVASLTTDTNALRFVAKGGANFMVDTQTALFVNGGMTEGLDNEIEGWDIGAGVKAMW